MIVLAAAFGPFLVWPLEHFLPYPYIIEELFKVALVAKGPKKFWVYAAAGIAFAFSETVLYALNLPHPLRRFIATSSLHAGTFTVIYFFSQKKLLWLGFLAGMILHFFYNLLVF